MYLKFEVLYFMQFDRLTIQSICKCLKLVTYEQNEKIFLHGDPSDSMMIVVKGQVALYAGHDFTQPHQVLLNERSILGERSVKNE
jgi:CRP-like cAMP-binding protein